MSRHPWMPLYVGDFTQDTQHLSACEVGAYILLIMHYWSRGGLPKDEIHLKRIARLTNPQWEKSKQTLAAFFDKDWRHSRIDRERDHASQKHQKLILSGKLGGQAKALKDKERALANARKSTGRTTTTTIEEAKASSISDADASLVNDAVVDLQASKVKSEAKAQLEAFGVAWNEMAGQLRLPQIDQIKPGSSRERNALARLREMHGDYSDLLAKIRASPYLRGEVNGFRCSFNWIINATNHEKIMEGTYADRRQETRNINFLAERRPHYGR